MSTNIRILKNQEELTPQNPVLIDPLNFYVKYMIPFGLRGVFINLSIIPSPNLGCLIASSYWLIGSWLTIIDAFSCIDLLAIVA